MSAPTLYLGARSGGAIIYRTEPTALDDAGRPIEARVRYAALYPSGGPDGEVVLHQLYVGLRHSGALTLRFTPIVDGLALAAAAYEATLPDRGRDHPATIKVPFSLPYLVDGEERSRYAPRGALVALLVEQVGDAGGRYRLDGVQVDIEVVRESLRPA